MMVMLVVRSASLPQLPLGSGGGGAPPGTGRSQGGGWGSAPPVGNYTYNNIPGYTGYIPGKYSENVLGSAHSRTNALALQACNSRDVPVEECHFARRTNHYGLAAPRRGADIPGYTGYIPAKHATNVYGTTFAESNNAAQHVRRELAAGRTHRGPVPHDAGPGCWTGNAALY